MDKHDRPYRCTRPECAKLQGFTYSGGLLRHEREVHGLHRGPKEKFLCEVPGCKRHGGKGFSREENPKEHLRRVHGITTVSDADSSQLRHTTADAAPLAQTIETPSNIDDSIVLQRLKAENLAKARQIDRMEENDVIREFRIKSLEDKIALLTPQILPKRVSMTDIDSYPDQSSNSAEVMWSSEAQQEMSRCHNSATSLNAPYTYGYIAYIDQNTIYADPNFGDMSTDVRIPGPPPQVGQVGQMAPQGIASPMSDNVALSRPISPSNVPIDSNVRKRSFSEMSQQPPPQMSKHARIQMGSYPFRAGESYESVVQSVEIPADNNYTGEASANSFSGIQSLMHRWFDTNATDTLSRL